MIKGPNTKAVTFRIQELWKQIRVESLQGGGGKKSGYMQLKTVPNVGIREIRVTVTRISRVKQI